MCAVGTGILSPHFVIDTLRSIGGSIHSVCFLRFFQQFLLFLCFLSPAFWIYICVTFLNFILNPPSVIHRYFSFRSFWLSTTGRHCVSKKELVDKEKLGQEQIKYSKKGGWQLTHLLLFSLWVFLLAVQNKGVKPDDSDAKADDSDVEVDVETEGESSSMQYRCSRCGRGYSRRDNRNRHARLECGQTPRFRCPMCPMVFTRKNNVTRHLARKHSIPWSSISQSFH